MTKRLRSFKPIVDDASRILILGSMPGPEALRKQQYYGFNGNHFWHIIPVLLGQPRPVGYEEKIKLVRRHGIALWDVLASCIRPTALDSDIKNIQLNKIPHLLKVHRAIEAVFINGRFAHTTFMKHYETVIDRPVFYLPSTSPANAAMTIHDKVEKWRVILKFLDV